MHVPFLSRRMCHPRSGFSQIELLAVIAILTIFGAILWPLVSDIRVRAHSMGCVSNLRSLGAAHALWRTDRALVYEEGYNVVNKRPSQLFFEGGYITDPKVFQCPAVSQSDTSETYPARPPYSSPPEYRERYADENLSIMANAFTIYRSWLGYGNDSTETFLVWNNHSEIPLFMDGPFPIINSQSWKERNEENSRIRRRHSEKANIVFMDGRVESLDSEGIAELHPLGDPTIRY